MVVMPKLQSASRRRTTLLRRILFLPTALLLASCSGGSGEELELSGRAYESVAEVMADSDGVLRVQVTDEIGRQLDDGGNAGLDGYPGGLPMVVLTASTIDGYDGAEAATVNIVYLDARAGEFTGTDGAKITPLEVGDDVVISFRLLTPEEMPGLALTEPVLVPTGGEDGMMDVMPDGRVVPRSASIRSLDESSQISADQNGPAGRTEFSLEDVSRLATARNAEAAEG